MQNLRSGLPSGMPDTDRDCPGHQDTGCRATNPSDVRYNHPAGLSGCAGCCPYSMHVVIARCRLLGISEALVEGEYAFIGQGIFTEA